MKFFVFVTLFNWWWWVWRSHLRYVFLNFENRKTLFLRTNQLALIVIENPHLNKQKTEKRLLPKRKNLSPARNTNVLFDFRFAFRLQSLQYLPIVCNVISSRAQYIISATHYNRMVWELHNISSFIRLVSVGFVMPAIIVKPIFYRMHSRAHLLCSRLML